MSRQYRSKAFERVAAEALLEYDPKKWPRARQWLARVGIVRLTAEAAIIEAQSLINSVHANVYRNDPELHALLLEARAAVSDLATASCRDSWSRFRRGER